jgi:hypothetical protein
MVMRRGGHQKRVLGLIGELSGQLMAPGGFDLWTAAGAPALGAGRAFVGFVDGDEVPVLLPNALADKGSPCRAWFMRYAGSGWPAIIVGRKPLRLK